MTVSSTTILNQYDGDGVTVNFEYTFQILDSDELKVLLVDANGTEHELVLDSQYEVTQIGDPAGGEVQLLGVYPNPPVPPEIGQRIVIRYAAELIQPTDFTQAETTSMQVIEETFDASARRDQLINERARRSIKFPEGDPDTLDATLPPAQQRAGKFLSFDETGAPITLVSPGRYRGDWTTATAYVIGDVVRDGAAGNNTGNLYSAATNHTSGTFSVDVLNEWTLVFELSAATDAVAAAEAAQAAAEAAAITASDEATEAAAEATEAAGYASDAQGFANDAAATAADIATELANLPDRTGQANKYIRVKNDESGYDFRTTSQVRSDIGALSDLVQDTTPQLGGTLDVNGQNITGTVRLNSLTYPSSDGANGYVLTTNGSGVLSFTPVPASGLTALVDDTNPTLGGDLQINGFDIVGDSSFTISTDSELSIEAAILDISATVAVDISSDDEIDITSWDPSGYIRLRHDPITFSLDSTGIGWTYVYDELNDLSRTFLLPLDDGNNGDVLTTDGNGVLSFQPAAGGSNTFSTIAVSGQSNVVADSTADTLTFAAGTGITLTTNAGTDTITITNSSPNLLTNGDKGDITVSSAGATFTIDNDVVTNAKLNNMAQNTIKGRISSGTGDPEDLSAANVKTILGYTASDVGAAATSFSTIAVSGQSNVVADSTADTLTLVAGTNVTITTNAGSDSITISSSGGGGGGGGEWYTDNTQAGYYTDFEQFINSNAIGAPFQSAVSGTSASITEGFAPAGTFGTVRLQTGTTSTGLARINTGSSILNVPSTAGVLTIEARVNIPVLSNGSQTFAALIGLVSASSTTPSGIYFKHDSTSGNWLCVNRNGGSQTGPDSGVAVSTSTYQKLRIVYTSSVPQAEFYINGSLVATNTTNLPSGNWPVGFGIIKSVGSTSCNFWLDYLAYKFVFTTPR